jgi:hypothetical protein
MQFSSNELNLLQYSIVQRWRQTLPDEEEYDPREQSKQLDPPERTQKKDMREHHINHFRNEFAFGDRFQDKVDNVLK